MSVIHHFLLVLVPAGVGFVQPGIINESKLLTRLRFYSTLSSIMTSSAIANTC